MSEWKYPKDDALKRLTLYAKHNGIQAPVFRWEMGPMGPTASMRGTKILENKGVPTAVTLRLLLTTETQAS